MLFLYKLTWPQHDWPMNVALMICMHQYKFNFGFVYKVCGETDYISAIHDKLTSYTQTCQQQFYILWK